MTYLGNRSVLPGMRPAVGMRDLTKNLAKKAAAVTCAAKENGCEWMAPLIEGTAAGRLVFGGINGPHDPWSGLERYRVPAVLIMDDTAGRGPEPYQALKRARFWLTAAYVAVDTTPDGAKVIELAHKHRRLLVIQTTAAKAEAWATWLKTRCPARKHATLRALGTFYDQHGLAA
jgi:hypothetical protein